MVFVDKTVTSTTIKMIVRHICEVILSIGDCYINSQHDINFTMYFTYKKEQWAGNGTIRTKILIRMHLKLFVGRSSHMQLTQKVNLVTPETSILNKSGIGDLRKTRVNISIVIFLSNF